ncbi:MAG: flagellar hook-length control protein FliK, partial [Thermotaleaceae bacterium]
KMIAIQTEQLPMDNRKEAPMIPTGNEKPAILLQDNKEGIQHPIKEENKNLEVNADKNMEIGMEKHIPKLNEILKNSSIHPEAGIIPEKKLPNFLENINIKNLTYEKIIFLLKNNFQTNLINAVKVNEILYREAPLGKQLQTLIAGLKDHKEMEEVTKTFENIQSKMKVSLIQDKAGLKDVIKELYSHVHRAGEMIESGVIRGGKELLQQVESVKNSIDFMNKINQYQGFIQLPLHINGQERNLEILLCNKNKKNSSKNPKDMKIFISLDTKTMETVQAFIEIKEKGVSCNFRLENERIKEYIEKNEKKLHHTLEALGFEKIDIRYNVFSGNLNLLQVLEEESQMKKTKRNFLDLRV